MPLPVRRVPGVRPPDTRIDGRGRDQYAALLHMQVSGLIVKALPKLYDAVNRTGLGENRWIKKGYYRAYFFYKKYIEDPFFDFTRLYPEVFSGGHVLDIGANIGYTASVFARALSPGYHVHAFEPEEENFRALRELAAARGLEGRMVPWHVAVGDHEGVVDLWVNTAHRGDHRIVTERLRGSGRRLERTRTVPLWTVDGFVSRQPGAFPVRFVKIDVQGFETAVCKGMQHTLETQRDLTVAFEYAPDAMREMGFAPAELLDRFQSLGYRLHVLTKNGSLVRIRPEKADQKLGNKGYVDLVCMK